MFALHPHDPPSIGPFTLIGRLGEDSCTRVYLASTRKHSEVALQVVRSTHTTEPAFRTAFTHRVESARELRSPYVAAILDADLDHATPWVAMERPPGPSLASLVDAHGPLPAGALHSLALALAQGLADLHTIYRTHASLSPEGVLLTERGAVLADAGFAWAVAEVNGGPPHPEFAAPEGGAAPATDVYSWAAVLCWTAGIQAGNEGLAPLPLQLRGLIGACLREEPTLRPTALDLVRMLGGPTTPSPWPPELSVTITRSAEATSSAVAAARPKRRKGRALTLTATGMSLALVAGMGIVWTLRVGSSETTEAATDTTPGLITDTGCLDDPGFPPPTDGIDDLDAMRVAFSPDGDLLAVTSYNHGLTLWDWREGEEIARPLDDEEVFGLGDPVFAPVGCMVAVRTSDQFTHAEFPHGLVTTLDIPSGQTREHLGPQSDRAFNDLEEPRTVESFDFSPSGEQMLVHLARDHSFENPLPALGVVDMDTGEPTTSWGGETGDLIHEAHFLDEDRIATLGQLTIDLRDAETGETEHTIRNVTDYSMGAGADGKHLVFLDEDHVVLWDVEAHEESDRFPIPEYHAEENGYLTALSVDTDVGFLHLSWAVSTGDAFLSPGTDRQNQNHGHLWDLETGQDLAEENDDLTPRPLVFHPRGEAIASIDHDGDVRLLDPETLAVIRTIS